MSSLTLAVSDRIAEACLSEGVARGFAPMTVVVLDAGGHVKTAKRSDGSGILRFEIAHGKAWGALGMGLPSRALAERAASAPVFFGALAAASSGRMIPVPGGVLVLKDGQIVGAVGVSGDTSDNDEVCAVAAIAASGLEPDCRVR